VTASTSRRNLFKSAIGLAASTSVSDLVSFPARADWPNRTVHIVVPFPPGGGADLISRLLAPHLQQAFGEGFIVENRSGAAGRIGTGYVAKADPDGETLLVTTESSIVIAPHIGVEMNYDPLKDLLPISLLTRNTVLLVVHPSVPANSLPEFMALLRSKPGQFTYGSSGVGGPNHLAGEIFKRMTGLDIVHVPFQGTGAALQAVIAHQVDAMWGFMAGLIPQVRAGTLRAIATCGPERSAVLPDVPTFAEAGVPGYEAVSWIGMFAPQGMDQKIADKLATAVKTAMQAPDVNDVLQRDGSEIAATTSAEFHQVIASDYAKYGKFADLLKGQ
jgi:tripartite-type tricarboxylate transporter receptor subunit TctC